VQIKTGHVALLTVKTKVVIKQALAEMNFNWLICND